MTLGRRLHRSAFVSVKLTIDCDLMIVIAFARSMQPDKTFAAGLPSAPDDLIYALIALVIGHTFQFNKSR